VISLEPDLEQIRESPVFSNVLWIQVAVEIDDRLRRGELPVEVPGSVVRQQEIFSEEAFHT
jgi:hypothetical protein